MHLAIVYSHVNGDIVFLCPSGREDNERIKSFSILQLHHCLRLWVCGSNFFIYSPKIITGESKMGVTKLKYSRYFYPEVYRVLEYYTQLKVVTLHFTQILLT